MAGAAFMTFITTGSSLFLRGLSQTKRNNVTAIIQQYAHNKAFFVTFPFYKRPKIESDKGVSKDFVH